MGLSKFNLTFSKLCLREGHLFNHSMAASNTISSLGTLTRSLEMISVSLSTHRDWNSSCVGEENKTCYLLKLLTTQWEFRDYSIFALTETQLSYRVPDLILQLE